MYLIDTSAWIDYFKPTGDTRIREFVTELLISNQASWCEMILLELQNSPSSQQHAAISTLEPIIPQFTITSDCWSYAYELARLSKSEGKPVPNTDSLIYATASIYQKQLFHNDKHFDWLDVVTGQKITER